MSWIEKITRPEILKLTAYSSARSEYDGIKLIQLDANENPNKPFGEENNSFNRYPEPQPIELRKRLAEIYGAKEEQLLITRGVDEGLELLISAFCVPYKDSIVITPPTFGYYEIAGKIHSAMIIKSTLDKNFEPNWSELERIKNKNVKIIFLCSPNNPTGNIISIDKIDEICSFHKEQSLIIVDEAYFEFTDSVSAITLLNKHSNLVVARTLSKAYALAGVRIGTLIAGKEIIDILKKIIPPYPLPTPCINIANKALSAAGIEFSNRKIDEIKKERERLYVELSKLPVVTKIYNSATNFLLVIVKDANFIYTKLKDNGIIVRNRNSEIKNALRITIGTIKENNYLLKIMRNIKCN